MSERKILIKWLCESPCVIKTLDKVLYKEEAEKALKGGAENEL